MKVLVLSCDKNEDTFKPFNYLMEKNWKDHPKIIYATETIANPYYETIAVNNQIWSERIKETLKQIEDNEILLLVDDIFIRKPVDTKRIDYARDHLKGNIAMFNFEKSFDLGDEETSLEGFKKRKHGSNYEVSIMCGLWDKEKLMKVIEPISTIWEVEYKQNNCNYDYYINSGDYIIDWGYETWIPTGLFKGKWCRNIIPFFEGFVKTID